MNPGMARQESARARRRLVPQSDDYADFADYTDQAQGRPSLGPGEHSVARGQWAGRAGYAGHRRKGRAARATRPRPIRFTITVLLVIPLLSLIALWGYAASSTVGGAIAERNTDTINQNMGITLQNLIAALNAERGVTLIWQSAHGRVPGTTMDRARAQTIVAAAAFQAGFAKVAGLAPKAVPVAEELFGQLSNLGKVRAQVDKGTIKPLGAFTDYTRVLSTVVPFSTALANPQESLALFQEGQAGLHEGNAGDDIAQEDALVGAALASGGTMSADEHESFVQAVGNQRLLERLGNSPADWQLSPDPYLAVYSSSAFKAFQGLEDQIVASSPGARLPASLLAAWQPSFGQVIKEFTAASTSFRLAVTRGQAHAGDVALLRLIFVGGAGLVAVIVSSVLLLRFGNRISRELIGLQSVARTLAGERLPSVVGRLRAGKEVDVAVEAPPLDLRTRTLEVADTADAFSVVQRTAVEAAVDQASLRKGVSRVFRSLARRNQSLLQRQLRLLGEMETATEDPDALEQLFRLDHLTTRMRRQAEGLIILSGASPGRAWRQPVLVGEVLRGAISEIEDYARVDLRTDSDDFMQGAAVADVTHMLAELVENAAAYSPPSTHVQVRGSRAGNGYVIEVDDRGLGIPRDVLDQLNERLARPPEFDLVDSDQLGLFVVSRLAARHGAKVSLRASPHGGTTAIVLLPRGLVVTEGEVPFLAGRQAGMPVGAVVAAGIGRAAAAGAAAEALTGRGRMWHERAPGAALPAREPAFPGEDPAVAGDMAADAGSVQAIPPGPECARNVGLPSRQAISQSKAGAALPRRQAGANLAPQLRGHPAAPGGPLAGRSPEQARALMSAIQRGLQGGRADAPADGDEGNGASRGWAG